MFLNKDLCFRCIEEWEHLPKDYAKVGGWKEDLRRWDNDYQVYCPHHRHNFPFSSISILQKYPPPWCPFALEQIMLANAKRE